MPQNKSYDIVYLTNTPSFYKLRLCEAIACRGMSLLLVLYGYGSEAVNTQLSDDSNWSFDWKFIHDGDANKRSKVKTFIRLLRLMHGISAKKILFSGWLAPEYNLYAFLSPRRRNAVICETPIYLISMAGISGWVKRRIIGRMSAALPSGVPHQRLFDSIGFNGDCHITGSVGIISKPARQPRTRHTPLRYLYVGRLIDLKNLRLLIDTFNANGQPLTIVGAGELSDELHSRAKDNITFTGFIDNNRLDPVYRDHDVFILPSYYDAWGLVVEEALYRGLPCIVSDRVGSAEDMVTAYGAGEIFDHTSVADLQRAIDTVAAGYDRYADAAASIDWDARENAQVDAYLKLLK